MDDLLMMEKPQMWAERLGIKLVLSSNKKMSVQDLKYFKKQNKLSKSILRNN